MLKTTIVYTDRLPSQPAIAELEQVLPILDIKWVAYQLRQPLQTETYLGMRVISWSWFKTLFGIDTVFAPKDHVTCLCTTPARLAEAGIRDHLGYFSTDTDKVIEFYISLSDTLDPRAKANGFKHNLAWIFCHEYLHGDLWRKTKDRIAIGLVHDWEAKGELKAAITDHLAEYARLEAQVSLLTKAVALLTQLFNLKKKPSMIHPLRLPFRNQITQKYGVPNSIYKRTGHHLGTDYACPVGTPIAAPQAGEIIETSSSPERGNYVYYKMGNVVAEFRHLSLGLKVGKYNLGDVIAYSGNTGTLTTGPHLCHVLWRDKVQSVPITRQNWAELTIDPEVYYTNIK